MRFHFHVVSADSVYTDGEGVDCDSLAVVIEQARAAVTEMSAEISFHTDGYLVITSSEPERVVLLPLAELGRSSDS